MRTDFRSINHSGWVYRYHEILPLTTDDVSDPFTDDKTHPHILDRFLQYKTLLVYIIASLSLLLQVISEGNYESRAVGTYS